jgi:cytidine deaminase
MVVSAGAADLDTCVAFHRLTVLSPCGSCREIIRDHGFRHVVVACDGELVTVTPDELLPWS